MQQAAPHVAAAPIVAQATGFSGTLTGSYSNIDAPGFSHILNYATSGTLSGVGSTNLRGTLIPRGGHRPGRLVGELRLRNNGGSMIVNVSQSATPGILSYKVARATGSDTAFTGGGGELMISQASNFSVPFYVSGQATMTFTPG